MQCCSVSITDKSRVPLVRLLASRLRSCPIASCQSCHFMSCQVVSPLFVSCRAVSRHLMSLTKIIDSDGVIHKSGCQESMT